MKNYKFVCPQHGEFEAKTIFYSCPVCADCPKCGCCVDAENDTGINIISGIEAMRKRPEFYKNLFKDESKRLEDPKTYQLYLEYLKEREDSDPQTKEVE